MYFSCSMSWPYRRFLMLWWYTWKYIRWARPTGMRRNKKITQRFVLFRLFSIWCEFDTFNASTSSMKVNYTRFWCYYFSLILYWDCLLALIFMLFAYQYCVYQTTVNCKFQEIVSMLRDSIDVKVRSELLLKASRKRQMQAKQESPPRIVRGTHNFA